VYALNKAHGLPRGNQTFVKIEVSLARFLALGERDLSDFLDAHQPEAITTLLKIVQWPTSAGDSPAVADKIASLSLSELPSVTSILGLASLKAAVTL
jgi:hypothetical protein